MKKKNLITIISVVIIVLAIIVTIVFVADNSKKGEQTSENSSAIVTATNDETTAKDSPEKTEPTDNTTGVTAPTTTIVENTTEKITEKNTEKATEKTTEKITQKVTEKVTEKLTEKVTEKETEKVSKKPKVTEKVTEKPKQEETTKANAPASAIDKSPIPGCYSATSFERAFFDRVNKERTSRGIAALKWNDNIHALAGIRAKEITSNFTHTRPNGTSPSSLLDQNNITRSAFGENLANGTPMEEQYIDALVMALMNSETHRANILNSKFVYAAVGATTNSAGLVYIAELFYTP